MAFTFLDGTAGLSSFGLKMKFRILTVNLLLKYIRFRRLLKHFEDNNIASTNLVRNPDTVFERMFLFNIYSEAGYSTIKPAPRFCTIFKAARSPEIIAAFREALSCVSPARKTLLDNLVSEGAISYCIPRKSGKAWGMKYCFINLEEAIPQNSCSSF